MRTSPTDFAVLIIERFFFLPLMMTRKSHILIRLFAGLVEIVWMIPALAVVFPVITVCAILNFYDEFMSD